MKKMESKFTTMLRKTFEERGGFFYKIPDASSAQRFMIKKPFDVIACVNGRSVAIECKYLSEPKAFGISSLSEHQIDSLEKHAISGGLSLVVFECKFGPRDFRAIAFQLSHLKNLCKKSAMATGLSIKKKHIEDFDWRKRYKQRYFNLLIDIEFFL